MLHKTLLGTLLGLALTLILGGLPGPAQAADEAKYWTSPERGAQVSALIPGRKIPALNPQNLYADWCRAQVERWAKNHPQEDPEQAYRRYAAAAPTDESLVADFPRHISPFGKLVSGKIEAAKAANVMITYCPFCGSQAMSCVFDGANPYHATTTCCHTQLYGREQDYPAGYALKPTTTVKFRHLDDALVEVPATQYRDKNGVEWLLFIRTLFDHRRWISESADQVNQLLTRFEDTADPVCVQKLAVILDQAADTYYGLPLSRGNEVCLGKDGQGLTRAEWEAVPKPNIFTMGPLGGWNKRLPLGSPGWLNMFKEQLWAEPFARVRHHPVFKYYSQKKYGDPEALDRKIMTKMLREIGLMFKTVFSQKLLHNYQEANYSEMWLLGVLLQDETLISFAGPCQELSMYNHSYQDGMNGEGAPNYMDMPGGYYYPYLKDPKGWLQYYPKFLEDNPFYWAASTEMHKTATVRGMEVEFGDQHELTFSSVFDTNTARVREREKIGSRNWAGYGVGIIRVGGPGHRQELCLDYTRASLHNARDAMSLECWVDGVPVLRKGGYSAYWHHVAIDKTRPEIQALLNMGYPHEIIAAVGANDNWCWDWSHSSLCQNTATVDEQGTGAGWGDNRGYGECLTFKGGEEAGTPGSGFQVIDARDHYSWWHVQKPEVSEFRRTVIGVEGPDGRPYALDLLKLTGGQRHALYSTVWGERAEDNLPAVTGRADNLAQVLFGDKPPSDNPLLSSYVRLSKIEKLAPAAGTWDLTWKTDYAAYAPRDPNGGAFRRPIPEDIGQVRLRCFGLNQPDGQTQLLRGKGPWVGMLHQALPGGQQAAGNVGLADGRDFLIEARRAQPDQKALDSLYARVYEGYREGEPSAIKSVTPAAITASQGPERTVVAVKVQTVAGHVDTVIYQSAPGTVKLGDGTQTDALYSLVRRDGKGEVIAAEAVRGTLLQSGKFRASLPGDFTGTIVDVIGDLTGTRQESALIIRPDKPWPTGDNLADRQLLIRFESALRDPGNEGYRLQKVTALPGGLVRVDLQDHAPFAVSWHQVTVLPTDQPKTLRTWRPMVDHGNSPWYNGLKIWFPERNKTYTIKSTNEVGGGYGGDTLEVVENVNLAADGIKINDWYVIYGVQPGLKVSVANDFSWRKMTGAGGAQQYQMRATGNATVTTPALAGALWYQLAGRPWQESKTGRTTFTGAETNGQPVNILLNKPAWLALNDTTPPALTRLLVDDKPLELQAATDLGAVTPPGKVAFEFRDADNPLDPAAVEVTLNGKPLSAEQGLTVALAQPDNKTATVTVDLTRALGPDGPTQIRRHVLQVAVRDRSFGKLAGTASLRFTTKATADKDALYLSDLREVKVFAHGGMPKDTDYVNNLAEIASHVYPKCLTLCPEAPAGYAEVIYNIPQDRGTLVFKAEVGISNSSQGAGSATFEVQLQRPGMAESQWETVFRSPTMRGGAEPVPVSVELGNARRLRLYTTDAGDGISSDHAVWGNARFRPAG